MSKCCSIEGCDGRVVSRDWCSMHYQRWLRSANISMTEKAKLPNGSRAGWIEKALKYESDECLLFPFPLLTNGYADINFGKLKLLAHRYVCEKAHGAPPTAKHEAAHSCGIRHCMNKAHLSWKTKLQNEADKLIHGTIARGERQGGNRLTEQQVLQIRAAKEFQRCIAKQFGITQQTVSNIKTRRIWAWLP